MTSFRASPTWLWLLVTTVTIAACGGTATPTPAPTRSTTPPYPCNLATTSQIEKAVGVPVFSGVATQANGQGGQPTDPRCSYALAVPLTGASGTTVPAGAVQITVVTSAEFAQCHLPPGSQGASSLEIRVPGANEAVEDSAPNYVLVCARRGATHYTVFVPLLLVPGGDSSPLEQAVAEVVAAHVK